MADQPVFGNRDALRDSAARVLEENDTTVFLRMIALHNGRARWLMHGIEYHNLLAGGELHMTGRELHGIKIDFFK